MTTVMGLLLIECCLFFIGVTPVASEDPFVGFAGYSPLFVEQTTATGVTVMKTAPQKLDWFNEQSFLREKPSDVCRIFTLGGSTTAGRPYDDATSFSRWLRELTRAFVSGRPCEVINAGGISYASYRVANVMEELVAYDPDIFIVYTGHNEFLERHTYGAILETPEWLRSTASLLGRSRIYSAARRAMSQRTASRDKGAPDSDLLPVDVDAILDRTVGPDTYHRDDAFREQVELHFQHSLRRMVEIAKQSGVQIIFVEPASNIRSCAPFKSEHRDGLTKNELKEWSQLVKTAQQYENSGENLVALETLDRACAIDDRVADIHYLRGRLLERLERYREAYDSYARAVEEDVCPLRALDSIRQEVVDIAMESKSPLIRFAAKLESVAADGIPGDDVFLDHVHPTIEGHQILGEMLFDELQELNVVEAAESYTDEARDELYERIASTIDRRAHALALRNLAKVYIWAGKVAESDRLALQAVTDLQDDAEALFLAGTAEIRRGNHERAIDYFQSATRVNPHHAAAHNNLGNELFQLGDLDRAAESFQKAVAADPRHALAYHNLAVIALEQGDRLRAEQLAQQALTENPLSFDTNWLLSKIYFQLERYDEAAQAMSRALEIRPDDANARADLEMLIERGRAAQ